MSGINIFQASFHYLTECVRNTIQGLDRDHLAKIFQILIETRNHNRDVIVDGQGRSLQSLLLMEDCLEHNQFKIILPASNANLRPWKKNDVFIFNSGSGVGSTIQHALAAKADGLHVIGMTHNAELVKTFDHILLLNRLKEHIVEYAPLGTEFEFTSAVIGACIGASVKDTMQDSLKAFEHNTINLLRLFEMTYKHLEINLESLMAFIGLISEYLPAENRRKVYFLGVGRNEIINRVAAIRYGHLHKGDQYDLTVIYEGHWDLRKKDDLAIIISGSGSTAQTLDFANQAFITGMRIFGITSFQDSDLGKFSRRVNGCLELPGRSESFSMYSKAVDERINYFPSFELNCYITFDALLAQIAHNFEITEDDMKRSHRSKVLE